MITQEQAWENKYVVVEDFDNPDSDFIAVRPWFEDGTVEFMVVDTVNDNGAAFSTMTAEQALIFAHAVMTAAKLALAEREAQAA